MRISDWSSDVCSSDLTWADVCLLPSKHRPSFSQTDGPAECAHSHSLSERHWPPSGSFPGAGRRPISSQRGKAMMMTDRTQTPAGHIIEKRNWKFGRGTTARRWWHGGDAGRTAFYNALSSTFPVGEKFFMSAVRHYRDEAPETLREQIDDLDRKSTRLNSSH